MNIPRKSLIAAAFIISLPAIAQNTGRTHLDKAQLQQLMQQAKQVQSCIANIDQKLMEEFKRKTKETDEEIKALCAAGKRSAAATRAKKFSEEMANSKVMRETQKCSASMLKSLPSFADPKDHGGGIQKSGHICDR